MRTIRTNLRLAASLAALAPALWLATGDDAKSEKPPRPITAPTPGPAASIPSRLGADDSQGEGAVWWARVGPYSSATLWVSPVLLDSIGLPVRWWVATCTLPGTTEPLSCLQGAVPADSADPIRFHGATFTLDVTPANGSSWHDVRKKDQLAVQAVGLD